MLDRGREKERGKEKEGERARESLRDDCRTHVHVSPSEGSEGLQDVTVLLFAAGSLQLLTLVSENGKITHSRKPRVSDGNSSSSLKGVEPSGWDFVSHGCDDEDGAG